MLSALRGPNCDIAIEYKLQIDQAAMPSDQKFQYHAGIGYPKKLTPIRLMSVRSVRMLMCLLFFGVWVWRALFV